MENKDNKFYVSHTKLNSYKTCPMKYYYKYIMGLNKKISKRAFYVGEDIHKLTELLFLHKTPELLNKRIKVYNEFLTKKPYGVLKESSTKEEWEEFEKKVEAWNKKAMEMYGDVLTWRQHINEIIIPRVEKEADGVKHEIGYNYVNDLIKMMGQYEYYYSNDKMKVLDLEHKKYSVLGEYNGKKVILTYISDGIVEVQGEQYLLERKSFKTEPMTFEETWLNVQTAEYVTELNKEGWNIKGVIWDNIRSKSPKDPNILKSGKFGKQSSEVTVFSLIDTSTIMEGPEAVATAVSNLSSEAFQLNISDNYNNFLMRHSTQFSEEAVKTIRKDTNSVIDIITKEEAPYYRNMGWSSCFYCEFKDLCQQEMLGHETKSLIDTLYDKRGEK